MLNFQGEQTDDAGVLSMDGEMSIACSHELLAALKNAFDKVTHLKLDTSQVTTIDLACLQLLRSAHLTSVHARKRLTVIECSEAFKQTVRDSGFFSLKGCLFECASACFQQERG